MSVPGVQAEGELMGERPSWEYVDAPLLGGSYEPECTCAMTEASAMNCAAHGTDEARGLSGPPVRDSDTTGGNMTVNDLLKKLLDCDRNAPLQVGIGEELVDLEGIYTGRGTIIIRGAEHRVTDGRHG